jgi:hypothetical protein
MFCSAHRGSVKLGYTVFKLGRISFFPDQSVVLAFFSMLRAGIILATLGASFALAQEQPVSQFEIAKHDFFDFGPPNDFYELFLVRPDQSGATVEKITLTPSVDHCFQPAKAELTKTSLNQTIPELLGKVDPCAIPEKELVREKKRCKKCTVFSGMNVSMLVRCGTQLRAIRADILDRDMFDPAAHTPEHTSWTMSLLAKLDQASGPSVMDRPVFPTADADSKGNASAVGNPPGHRRRKIRRSLQRGSR